MPTISRNGIDYSLPDQIVLTKTGAWSSGEGLYKILDVSIEDTGNYGRDAFRLTDVISGSLYWLFPQETTWPIWLTPKQFEALKSFI